MRKDAKVGKLAQKTRALCDVTTSQKTELWRIPDIPFSPRFALKITCTISLWEQKRNSEFGGDGFHMNPSRHIHLMLM